MNFESTKYDNYISILAEELIPSIGCTEPACLALAGAKLREVLGGVPDNVKVKMSGNLIKNTKSVTIPYSNGLKGIEAAIWLGILGGDTKKGLVCLSTVTDADIKKTKELLQKRSLMSTELLDTSAKLHLILEAAKGEQKALVEILHSHTNFSRIELNDQVLLDTGDRGDKEDESPLNRQSLNVKDILAFADCVNLDDVREILTRQIEYNIAIAEEGLEEKYGSGIGKHLLARNGTDVSNLARATAAAASDARMDGCQMPVVINSGSGNQGLTVSIPVIIYANHYNLSEEKLLRALCVSNLIAIHQKTGVGRLSAYCGAVSAACGSGAGITYMLDGNLEQVSDTITNTLANISGIICDGAKASCAAKIASSVDASLMAHDMALKSLNFAAGDGIVKSHIEETIDVVRDIASEGMRETDINVIHHMIQP